MNRVIGLINDTKRIKQLKELIEERSTAAIPIGGRYRLIDFTLSNMINSGIESVGILTGRPNRSLLGHLRAPKEWDLDRKVGGLFILPPDYEKNLSGFSKGDIENFSSNMDYICRGKEEYVLICEANMVYNMNYYGAFKYHMENNNDITIIFKDTKGSHEDFPCCTTLKTNGERKITHMETGARSLDSPLVSLEAYIMKKELLNTLVEGAVSRGEYDFLTDVVIKNFNKYRVYGWEFKGYASQVCNLQSYYRLSMNMLKPDIWRELFFKHGYIYTRAGDQPPVRYGSHCICHNSIVANGAIVEGNVYNSIIFRRVKVGKNSEVRNSIIMQNCTIGEDCFLENVILDKDSMISPGKYLSGTTAYPLLIEKKSSI